MTEHMENIYLAIVLAPLTGAIIAGLFGRVIGRSGAHWVTIIGVGVSSILSMLAWKHIVMDGGEMYNGAVYTWLASGDLNFQLGFLIDRLYGEVLIGKVDIQGLINIAFVDLRSLVFHRFYDF